MALRWFAPETVEDQILREYISVTESIDSVPAQNLTVSHGERCLRCGGGPQTLRAKLVVCVDCNQPWVGEELFVFRERRSAKERTMRTDIAENRTIALVDRWRKVRSLIEVRPRCTERYWCYVLLAWSAHVHHLIGNEYNASHWGMQRHPEFKWSPERVRVAITYGRGVVRRRWLTEVRRVKKMEKGNDNELIGPSEAASMFGLTGVKGIRWAQRAIAAGRIEERVNLSFGERLPRWKAPRRAWKAFLDTCRVVDTAADARGEALSRQTQQTRQTG